VRQTVERFSGQKFKEVKRLVLQDEAGELYGVPELLPQEALRGNQARRAAERALDQRQR
jgi:hypothetical protein